MIVEKIWEEKKSIFNLYFDILRSKVDVKSDWTVAEFGIGRWGFGRFYKEHVKDVYGIDIENYSKLHPTVKFVMSDGLKIPMKDNSVDLVASHSVLEHVGDLDASLSEINRITRPGGYFYLTVNPLYYSGYGAHLYRDGQRLENWQHLDKSSEFFMIDNPLPGAKTIGHNLNKLSSGMFLSSVAKVPWDILMYQLNYENKPIPDSVDRYQCSTLDLITKSFKFIGRKNKTPKY